MSVGWRGAAVGLRRKRRAHQDEDEYGEDGRPETGVDREGDELEDHPPGTEYKVHAREAYADCGWT